MTIIEYEKYIGTYTIVLNNARSCNNIFKIIEEIIRMFINSEELFFGFYRVDGVYLTSKQIKRYSKEIPAFFQTSGCNIKRIDDHLMIAKTMVNEKVYKMLPQIFNYFLETIVFSPKVSWETFEEYYSHYMKNRNEDYIINGFADILFSYFDSEDFMICFNSMKYDSNEVRNAIEEIINNRWDERQ